MLDLLRLKGTKRNYLSIKIPSFCIITYLEIIRKSQFFLFAWLLIWSTTSDHDQLDDCFSNCIVVRQAHSNFESLEKPDRGSAFLNFRREKNQQRDIKEMYSKWETDMKIFKPLEYRTAHVVESLRLYSPSVRFSLWMHARILLWSRNNV